MIVLFVLVNLCRESISLAKNEILGFLDKEDVDICKITTSTSSKPLTPGATQKQSEGT